MQSNSHFFFWCIPIPLQIFIVVPFEGHCRKMCRSFLLNIYEHLTAYPVFCYAADCPDKLMFASLAGWMKNSDVMLEQKKVT